jgi:phage protein D
MPAAEKKFLSQFFIKIGGADAPEAFMDAILEVTVDTSLYLPEMFTILLRDPDLKWVDDEQSTGLGKEVEISAQAGGDLAGAQGSLIKGEITALEPHFSGLGETTVLIRGYSKSHRLHRGRKSRTFLKQTDSAIVQKIAQEVGLSAKVDATSVQHDYIIQSNQTNMEFLQARASRLGYRVFATDTELRFVKGDTSLGQGPALELGTTLRTFRPILSLTHQSNKVTVKGWDTKQKQTIVGTATPNQALNQGGIGKTGGAMAQSVFGTAETILVNQPVITSDEATALAKGISDDLSNEFIQADGECYGDPRIKAGYTIEIKNVGKRFSGKYFITSATHILTPEEGYQTKFSISGRQPNTMAHLLGLDQSHNGGSGSSKGQGASGGVAIGVVTNANDPDNLGRVKVKYPWLSDEVESDWARIAAPGAGATRGFAAIPEPNDEVLMAFEHGDMRRPYILGGLWNGKDKLPQTDLVEGGVIKRRIWKSKNGHIILLDDSDGQEKMIVRDKTTKNEIIIDTSSNTITVNADTDINLNAKQNITIKAGMNLKLDCNQLDVQAKANGTIKANANLNLEGTAGLTAKSTANATFEGTGMATVKSAGIMTVQGTLVKIN